MGCMLFVGRTARDRPHRFFVVCRPDSLLNNSVMHSTSTDSLNAIKSSLTVRGTNRSPAAYVRALARPDAPTVSYFLGIPSSRQVFPICTQFPESCESGEEVGNLILDLSSVVLPHSRHSKPLSHFAKPSAGQPRRDTNAAGFASDYDLYLCGVYVTPFGPLWRSTSTALVVFARKGGDSVWARRHGVPLDMFDNDILRYSESHRAWRMATEFVVDPAAERRARPLRVVIALSGDVDVSALAPIWSKSFHLEVDVRSFACWRHNVCQKDLFKFRVAILPVSNFKRAYTAESFSRRSDIALTP